MSLGGPLAFCLHESLNPEFAFDLLYTLPHRQREQEAQKVGGQHEGKIKEEFVQMGRGMRQEGRKSPSGPDRVT